MSAKRNTNPTTWEDYQYGTQNSHRSSISSVGARSVHFNGEEQGDGAASHLDPSTARNGSNEVRRRRSSIALRFNALTHVGGVNSIENFARSWTRAAGFAEVAPNRPSFIVREDQGPAVPSGLTEEYGRQDIEEGRSQRSLIRDHLDSVGGTPENAIEESSGVPDESEPLMRKESHRSRLGSEMNSIQGRDSIFAIAPHLATPLAGSYGASYGTLQSTLSRSSMNRAAELWREQEAARLEGERHPILVKEIEQDGKKVYIIAGQSTLPQTIFNSTNVLIGVGLLSLPMGMKYAGWVCGAIFLFLAALVTSYTARLLAKCMDADPHAITFADLALISYGQKARIATSFLFAMELLAACVALVVLFGDTLDLLIPGFGVTQWKILCGLLLIPLNFVPLRLLSFSSVIGIFSCFCIVLIVFVDGFIKPHYPGSLREPAATNLFPNNWLTLPLSFGLLMSPWGGHSVFPDIYRDMRHPHKFGQAVKATFGFTYMLDFAIAVGGLLMFGDRIMNEVTGNILASEGYPRTLSILTCIFIAIIPLTKVPLNARPIVSTLESLTGLGPETISDTPMLTGMSGYTRGILRFLIRILVIVIFVIVAIVFPAFDSIMAFMGSTLCFTICVILPLLFYLKIFGKEVSTRERILAYFLITISSILAAIGTVFAFLPKSMIGAE